jgi:hypothetical protein
MARAAVPAELAPKLSPRVSHLSGCYAFVAYTTKGCHGGAGREGGQLSKSRLAQANPSRYVGLRS